MPIRFKGGEVVDAREELFRALDDGTVWLSYLGHASSTALSGEGIMKYSDIGGLYLRRLPFIFAATCNFMRWDADAVSGAEMLAATKGGGVIGAISATRPVYITQNGMISSLIGEELLDLDADGLLEPARLLATKRVVVKRPDYAPPLANVATPNAVVTKASL